MKGIPAENPILYIVIPCYNEQEVLPITSKLIFEKDHRPGCRR